MIMMIEAFYNDLYNDIIGSIQQLLYLYSAELSFSHSIGNFKKHLIYTYLYYIQHVYI